MKNLIVVFVIGFLACWGLSDLHAQVKSKIKEDEEIPFDPAVRMGLLKNGFSYYLLKSDDQPGKAIVSFIVKAGLFYENEDQHESAHWIEHLAIRGTKNYPSGLFDFMEKHGILRGNGVNATVNQSTARYYVNGLPTRNKTLLREVLLRYRDMNSNVNMDSASVYGEAAVVVAEGFGKLDHETEFQATLTAKLLNNSRWSASLSKPLKRNIAEFNRKTMIEFYERWYRPDREAVVIVGDIDVNSVEKEIVKIFSSLKNPTKKFDYLEDGKNRAILSGERRLIVLSHEDQKSLDFEVHLKYDHFNNLKKINDLRASIVQDLYTHMIRKRIERLLWDPNNDFVRYANMDFHHFAHAYEGVTILGGAKDADKFQKAFRCCLLELERVKRFGFSDDELSSAKQLIAKGDEERANTSSAKSRSLVDHFVSGSAVPSSSTQTRILSTLLREITMQEVQDSVKEWLSTKDVDIVIKTPKKWESLLPSENTLYKWMDEIRSATELSKPDSSPRDITLNPSNLTSPGNPQFVKRIEGLDLTEYRLDNGIIIYLKPYNHEGKVDLYGISKGGSDLYNSTDNIHARYAARLVMESGISNINSYDLLNFLTQQDVKLSPFISPEISGVTGTSSSDGLELMLQAVYHYFQYPNINSEALDRMIKKELKDVGHTPEFSMADSIKSITEGVGGQPKVTSPELNQLNLDKTLEIYKERFTLNVGDFVFFICGDLDSQAIDLINKYLGALPKSSKVNMRGLVTSKSSEMRDIPFVPETTIFSSAKLNGAKVNLVVVIPALNSLEDRVSIDVFETLLGRRMNDRLRTKEGGVFIALTDVIKLSTGQYKIEVKFECSTIDSVAVDKLIMAAIDEFETVRKGAISEEEFLTAVKISKDKYQQIISGVNFLSYAFEQVKEGSSLSQVVTKLDLLCVISIDKFKNRIKGFYDEDSIMRFILL
jgi:zinc protease